MRQQQQHRQQVECWVKVSSAAMNDGQPFPFFWLTHVGLIYLRNNNKKTKQTWISRFFFLFFFFWESRQKKKNSLQWFIISFRVFCFKFKKKKINKIEDYRIIRPSVKKKKENKRKWMWNMPVVWVGCCSSVPSSYWRRRPTPFKLVSLFFIFYLKCNFFFLLLLL